MARWKKGLIIGVCLLCVAGFVIAFLIRYRAKRGSESYSPPSVSVAPMPDFALNKIPPLSSFLSVTGKRETTVELSV